MIDRITRAFMFRKGVYSEVAADTTFTTDAWLIVLVVQFLSQLGTRARLAASDGFLSWVIGTVLFAAFGVLAFALGAFLVSYLARTMFKSTATFDQMQRAMGLAHVWNVIGLLGIITAVSVTMSCLLAPISVAAGLAGLAAYLFAVRETTGMDWVGTVITVVAAMIVQLIVLAIASGIIGLFGITAAGIFG